MKIVIVLPCYNEEAILEKNIKQVAEAVKNLPHDIKIVISDNNSKDRTAEIGKRLAQELPSVNYMFVGEPGKGAAVMEAWKNFSDFDVYGFMDADLAMDLEALPRALEYFTPSSILPLDPPSASPLPPDYRGKKGEEGGGYDVVIGSRRIKGAEAKRELYRKFISAGLSFLIKLFLKTKIKDTPCGFKFFRKAVLDKVLPQVKDRQWVFDTELLILAERSEYSIKEMPVKWAEKNERGSKVNIYPTAMEYLKKIWEIRKRINNVVE
ncbi:MAG: glycosyltransferase [bacterium]